MAETIDLDIESTPIRHLCARDKRLAKVITMLGRLEYTPYKDNAFEFLVHEIIEQMLSIRAGQSIYVRLMSMCANNITPETLTQLSVEDIKQCGTSTAKASCILDLARRVANDKIVLDRLIGMDDETVIKILTAVRGIGNWTAKMYLIFVLDRQDVLPYEDGAFLQSYRWLYQTTNTQKQSIIKKCRKWKPYSSIAARYLYRALDSGFAKQSFAFYS